VTKLPKAKAGQTSIDRNDKYRFYQVLIGTWPLIPLQDAELKVYRGRIRDYMIKAIREAKHYTSWTNPNEDYELAVSEFVYRCLDSEVSPLFLQDFAEFERQIRKPGLFNALAQVLLQLTSPGVPVENRRPGERRRLLAGVCQEGSFRFCDYRRSSPGRVLIY